jgi:hypothetical protein
MEHGTPSFRQHWPARLSDIHIIFHEYIFMLFSRYSNPATAIIRRGRVDDGDEYPHAISPPSSPTRPLLFHADSPAGELSEPKNAMQNRVS